LVSITHIIDGSGALVEELDYGAGDSVIKRYTSLMNEPEFFLGCGYMGDEHLSKFGLINYECVAVRFGSGAVLSSDLFVQDPDQDANFKYKYTEPTQVKGLP
jgi:hypothetical protein